MKKNIKILILALILISVFIALNCQASKFGEGLTNTAEKLGYTTVATPAQYAANIVKAALSLVGIIFTIMIIYGGFIYMTARGEETPITKGKKILTAAIIGLFIVISGYSITYFIASQLESPGASPPSFSKKCEDVENLDYHSCTCCQYRYKKYPQTFSGDAQCCEQTCCSTGCGCLK